MASNGKLPADQLAPINGPNGKADRLAKGGSAAGWNAMCHKAKKKGMAIPYPTGPNSSYRDYESQQYFYDQYLYHGGNLAAYPGTSNHGWGDAVDCATSSGVSTIKSIGREFGWYWGEVQSEWWRVTFNGSYGGSNPGPVDEDTSVVPLKQGDKGKDVHDLQGRLKRLGFHPLKDEYSNSKFGSQTEQIVKRFQQNNGLKVDGVVGHNTYDEIKRRLKTIDRLSLTADEDHLVDNLYRHHRDKDFAALRDQLDKIHGCAHPNDWDVHDRKQRYDTINQIVNKHGKLHVQ